MDITVNPGRLSGTVAAPPSKSDLHRKCIAAAFCGDGAAVRAAALCDDTRATLDCLAAMGFSVGFDGESVRIGGRDPSVREATLDCGESGSTARFLLPAAAYFLDCATLVGRGRLPARPFAALTDALRANGTAVRGDFLPIAVSGGLHAGVYRMRGDVSSQFFTGLLLALPALGRESSVELTTPLESAPYVTDVPDLLPALAVAAGASTGRTVFRGAARLRLKESDRLQSICAGLNAIGGRASETADGIVVEGTGGFAGGRVDSFGDHRIAMAFAVAATASERPVTVCGAECASKSYETFFDEYERLGGRLSIEGSARA